MTFRAAIALCLLLPATVARAQNPQDPHACVLIGPQRPYDPFERGDFLRNLWNPAWNLAGYKVESQVDRYLGCWKSSDANFLAYKTKYKKLIQAAADATHIPFSILACLYFYESKFDKDVVSPVGAKGLAQIMPGTWKAMVANLDTDKAMVSNPYVDDNLSRALVKTPLTARDRNAIRPIVARVVKLYKEKSVNDAIKGKANLETLRNALDELEKYPAFAQAGSVDEYRSNVEAALDRYEMREMFDRYKKTLGKSKLTMDPFSPEAAIIMGALTLKVNVFQGVFGQEYRHGTHDRWVIAAGGYNIGPAAIKCTENTSAVDCINITRKQELKRDPSGKRTETSDHMRGIKNCSEHQNMRNKLDQPHPRGCQG